MIDISLKWKKYMILEKYGLTSMKYLNSSIIKFEKQQLKELRRHIDNVLENNQNVMIIIKLVINNKPQQLPNIKIKSSSDAREALLTIKYKHAGKYDKIWCCHTDIDNKKYSVAGRIMYSLGNYAKYTQILEQIWHESPRMIEEYSNKFKYPYIRCMRESWGYSYKYDRIHIPEKAYITENRILQDISKTFIMIEEYRKRLEMFEKAINGYNIEYYSIEYKIVDSTMYIIDWDSYKDETIIRGEKL